jgi:hypothetical protein
VARLVEVLALGVVDLAELAVLGHPLDDLGRVAVAVVLGQHVLHAPRRRPLGRPEQPEALLEGVRGRYLAQDVLAGVQRRDRLRRVELRRCRDHHDVEVARQERLVLGDDERHPLPARLLAGDRVEVADGPQLRLRHRAEDPPVPAATPAADDPDLQLRHVSPRARPKSGTRTVRPSCSDCWAQMPGAV